MDKQLDSATTGPLWLKNPDVADCVSRILLSGTNEWHFYELHAWVIMANHVHVLMHPLVPVHKAIMNVKSASARAANKVLNRTGKHFCQDESYDHWVRNDRERNAIIRYIHFNPIKAGLVRDSEDWPWSSASRQRMALPHSRPRTLIPSWIVLWGSAMRCQQIYLRASNTRLKGVSAALRIFVNPPSAITFVRRASPACAPSANPTSCDFDAGVHRNVDAE